jgi:hypothetical protein
VILKGFTPEVELLYNRLLLPAWNGSQWTPTDNTTTYNYFSTSMYDMGISGLLAKPSTPVSGSWRTLTPIGSVAGMRAYFNTDNPATNNISGGVFTQLTDLSGTAAHFTSGTGPTVDTGAFGGASTMLFNGSSQFLTMASPGLGMVYNTTTPSDYFFFSAGINTASGGSTNYMVFFVEMPTSNNTGISFYIDKTSLKYNVNIRCQHTDSVITLGTGSKYHQHGVDYIIGVLVDFAHGVVRIYRNGFIIFESTQNNTSATRIQAAGKPDNTGNSPAIFLGKDVSAASFFKGNMAHPVFLAGNGTAGIDQLGAIMGGSGYINGRLAVFT